MAEAKYEVLIPKTDYAGQPVPDLAPHALRHITKELKLNLAWIDSGRQVFWNGNIEPFDALIFRAEDKPQTDSVAKQLATYLGEVANQDVILVSKEGKSGIQTWPVRNLTFKKEEGPAKAGPSDPLVV